MLLNKKSLRLSLTITGFILIIATGILEYFSPRGVIISWGYMVGIIFTLASAKRKYVAIAALLSFGLVGASFFYMGDVVDLNVLIISRLYALAGLLIMGFVAVREINSSLLAEENKIMMAGIFNNSTEGIILINNKNEISLINPFAEKLFGFEQATLSGRSIQTLIPGFLSSKAIEGYRLNGDPVNQPNIKMQLIGNRNKESNFPMEVSFNRFESGGNSYVVLFVQDITKRKEEEDMLKNKTAELETAVQELEAFSYSVSHDLRSPLRAVGGYAEMLDEDYHDVLDSEGIRLLGNIKHNADKMGKLIDDLLTFSRLGKKTINASVVDMYELVGNCVTEINAEIKNNAEIIIQPLHYVFTDMSMMHQVIKNMLSNAIKYSSKKEKPVIQIESREENDEIIFSVKDNGAGFDPDYKDKLFGVFQRLHSDREFEGTGVGLAIANRIITRFDGKMWAEGAVNEGATFYFSLPRALIIPQAKDQKAERLEVNT